MNFKNILLMIITLASVFLSIFVSTIYTGFVAPYLIGFFTPIIVMGISMIDIDKIIKKQNSRPTEVEKVEKQNKINKK